VTLRQSGHDAANELEPGDGMRNNRKEGVVRKEFGNEYGQKTGHLINGKTGGLGRSATTTGTLRRFPEAQRRLLKSATSLGHRRQNIQSDGSNAEDENG
jgi:hypothetical protein